MNKKAAMKLGEKTIKAIGTYVGNRLPPEPITRNTEDVDNVVNEAANVFQVEQNTIRYICDLPTD